MLEACFVFVDNRQQPGTGQAQAMTMLLSVEALSPRAKKKEKNTRETGLTHDSEVRRGSMRER